MCATTKYVSVTLKSTGAMAWSTPVSPPSRKITRNPTVKSMGVGNRSCPPHMVPIQLKNFTPVGTAMSSDRALKNGRSTTPVANMWWAQTPTDRPPIASVAKISVL